MAKLSLFDRRRRRVRTALRARASGKPRLSVHRSGKHIYAQVIDDAAGKTLVAASTLDKDIKGKIRELVEHRFDFNRSSQIVQPDTNELLGLIVPQGVELGFEIAVLP